MNSFAPDRVDVGFVLEKHGMDAPGFIAHIDEWTLREIAVTD